MASYCVTACYFGSPRHFFFLVELAAFSLTCRQIHSTGEPLGILESDLFTSADYASLIDDKLIGQELTDITTAMILH